MRFCSAPFRSVFPLVGKTRQLPFRRIWPRWIERLEGHGHHRRRGQRPEIGRAIGNLMTALRNRIAHEGWNDRFLDEVVDILDEAAQRIERVRDAKGKDD